MKHLYLFCLLLFATVIIGQNPITINGHVYDEEGTGLEGLPVFFVSHQDSNFFVITNTDINGFYEMDYDEGQTQGCLDVVTFNCQGNEIVESLCWNPGQSVYTVDFISDCQVFDSCFVYIEQELLANGETVLTAESPNAIIPVNFLWSTGDTTQSITVDSDGEYCVSMTDANGCVAFNCSYVGIPQFCDAFFYYDPLFGYIEALAEGEGMISYEWTYEGEEVGVNEPIIDLLGEGEYCLTIEDEVGCSSVYCDYVTIDSIPFENCFAFIFNSFDSLGNEVLIAQGFGQPPFTYSWSTGETTEAIQVQGDSVYCVEVVDANGCTASSCYEPFIWEDCSVHVSCDPSPDGVSLVAIAYGVAPFTFEWSTGETTDIIEVTESGEYCVTVTDASGCVSDWCQFVQVGGFNICEFELEILHFTDTTALVDVIDSDSSQFLYLLNGIEVEFPLELDLGMFYCFEGIDDINGCIATSCIDLYYGGNNCTGYAFITVDTTASGLFELTAQVFEGTGPYDVVWSNGQVGQTITVGNTPFGYCAEIYDVTDSCYYGACVEDIGNPPGFDDLFVVGVLTDVASGFPLEGTVTIYEKEDTVLTELDVLTVVDGVFTASLECNREYIFKGEGVDPNGVEEYIPTFSHSEEFWENAEVYACNPNMLPTIVNIGAIRLNGLGGPGTVEGFVFDGENFRSGGSGDRNDEPVENADIYLMTADLLPLKHVKTDANGKYKITGIAYGTYKVYLAIPGVKTQFIEVVIAPSNAIVTNVDFDTDGILNSSNDLNVVEVTVSPNPTSELLFIKGLDVAQYDVAVFDQMGRMVLSKSIQNMQLNVDQLPNGVYTLRIFNNENIASAKFIKL